MPREVPLSRGYVALVDDQDYERVMQHTWHTKEGARTCYGRASVRVDTGVSVKVYLHRFIVDALPEYMVDHRNGNGLDCTRANLRVATAKQNNFNRHRRAGTSRYKGVRRFRDKWRAEMQVDGRPLHLGLFKFENDAARAYDLAALQHYGEFAKLNFDVKTYDLRVVFAAQPTPQELDECPF